VRSCADRQLLLPEGMMNIFHTYSAYLSMLVMNIALLLYA
jgi:hypothetical protein